MKTLNDYRIAEFPSNSSVASGVTSIVSLWFLVAAGAILTDPPSVYTQRVVNVAQQAPAATVEQPLETASAMSEAALVPAVAAAPDARFTITVEARRLKV